jgi:Uma2 family endonuclease
VQEEVIAVTIEKTIVDALSDAADDEDLFHYYDRHPTREDLMGESAVQSRLIMYLLNVLTWLYRAEGWFIISNLNIYTRRNRYEYPITPDIAVFKDVVIHEPIARTLSSWRLYEPNQPAPQVVFEISSRTTWKDDLEEKPAKFAAIGVHEYYAYDPNTPPYWPQTMGRLRGWHLNQGSMIEQPTDSQGRIWSPELDSWLTPDGSRLRLYAPDGRIRLTEGEAERAEKKQAQRAEKAAQRAREAARRARDVERAAKEAERAAKEAERRARDVERAAKEAERAAKEAAEQARDTERAAKEAAWAKLRELGIDPETLG